MFVADRDFVLKDLISNPVLVMTNENHENILVMIASLQAKISSHFINRWCIVHMWILIEGRRRQVMKTLL
jgi:hypothetical protein